LFDLRLLFCSVSSLLLLLSLTFQTSSVDARMSIPANILRELSGAFSTLTKGSASVMRQESWSRKGGAISLDS
jgi:hypothetical protein